jgi:hypothetical protein
MPVTSLSRVPFQSALSIDPALSFLRAWSGILLLICKVNLLLVDHSGRAAKGVNCLRPPKHGGRGFESHSRLSCLCVYYVFAVLCIESGRPRSLINCVQIEGTEKVTKAQQRAVEI